MKRTFTLFVFLFAVYAIKAQLIMGSSITYRPFDSVTYEVTVKIFQDCYNTAEPKDSINVTWTGGSFKSRIYKVSVRDVTNYGTNCSVQSKCTGGGQYGVREITYKDTISLQGIGACNIILEWRGIRPQTITMQSDEHYNYTELNKCLASSNTSVDFSLPPQIFAAVGQDYYINLGIHDRGVLTDSLSFSLACPLGKSGISTVWTPPGCSAFGGFTPKCPGTWLGFPVTNLGFPAGCQIDSLTGQIAFRPTVLNQMTQFAIEVKEWRRINGVMTSIGLVRHETTLLVVGDSNRTTRIFGRNGVACTGQEICLEVSTDELDPTDSVTLTIVDLDNTGAIITIDAAKRLPTAKICWTPDSTRIRSWGYNFLVTARDNRCDRNGVTSRIYSIYVRETPQFTVTSKSVQCNEADITVVPNKNYGSIFQKSFMTADSLSYSQTGKLVFYGTGWQKFYAYGRTASCSSIVRDSVFISPPYQLNIAVKNDTAVCRGDSVKLFANPLNGAAPYKFYWDNPVNDSAQSLTHQPASTGSFFVNVIDSNRCASRRAVKVTINELPEIDAGPNNTVCPNMPFNLVGRNVSGHALPYKYEWVGLDTLRVISTSINGAKKFYLKATDQKGCKSKTDSVVYQVYPVKITPIKDTTLCFGGSVRLESKTTGTKQPVKFEWMNTGVYTPDIHITPLKDSTLIVKATDKAGCELWDTVTVLSLQHMVVNASSDTGVCAGNPVTLRVLNQNGALPVTYLWDNGAATDSVHFTANTSLKRFVTVRDKFGCMAADTVMVDAYAYPVVFAGFNRTICPGVSTLVQGFAHSSKPPYQYLWSNGRTTDSFSVTLSQPEQYALTATDANGCAATDSVFVDVYPHAQAVFKSLPDLCANENDQQLQAFPLKGTWSGAGIMAGDKFSPLNAGAGAHNLYYNYNNVHGCKDEDTLQVNVLPIPQISFTIDKDSGTVPFTVQMTNTSPGYTHSWKWTVVNTLGNLVLNSSLENPQFTIVNAARYHVIFTARDSQCSNTELKPLAIEAYNPKITTGTGHATRNHKIYPNPAAQQFIVEGENIAAIQLTDMQGRVVPAETMQLDDTRWQVLTPGVSPGVYIVRVTGTAEITTLYTLIISD